MACLVVQSMMHIAFCSRLTGKKQKAGHFAVYISILCILEWTANHVPFPWILVMGAQVFILYGVNRFLLGNRSSVSWIPAVLAVYISQLSFGIINSIELLVFPYMVGSPLLYFLVIAASMVSFAVCAVCYVIIQKSISLTETDQIINVECLLVPVLFFFASELYIMETAYSQTTTFSASTSFRLLLENTGKQTALLILQILGLAGLICSLYAYRYLCRSQQTQMKMQALTQAAQAQKVYIAEAQTRYEQTKAFRHDLKNHLSVLDGLLSQGKLEESKAYLEKLKEASALLTFPYQTGNPVVDILLGEKLGLAETKEIAAEVSLLLPKSCEIDDFDLCVIFANALDNAIRACQSAAERKYIRVSGEQQGDFYVLAFENTCPDEPLPPQGTGLSNIRSVAEKYHGAILTEKTGGYFSLHVLLNISLSPEMISRGE